MATTKASTIQRFPPFRALHLCRLGLPSPAQQHHCSTTVATTHSPTSMGIATVTISRTCPTTAAALLSTISSIRDRRDGCPPSSGTSTYCVIFLGLFFIGWHRLHPDGHCISSFTCAHEPFCLGLDFITLHCPSSSMFSQSLKSLLLSPLPVSSSCCSGFSSLPYSILSLHLSSIIYFGYCLVLWNTLCCHLTLSICNHRNDPHNPKL